MTNKEKIKYLAQYPKLELEHKIAHKKYIELNNRTIYPEIEDYYFKVLSLREIMDNTDVQIKKIFREIKELEDPLQRTVLNLRYIQDMSWNKICIEISYEWTWTHKIHSFALQNIRID